MREAWIDWTQQINESCQYFIDTIQESEHYDLQ
jgi:hypothetical protein